MIYTIIDNIIIIILTVLGLFRCRYPAVLIIIAALCMIKITYQSFNEDIPVLIKISDIIILPAFALISGNFSGFQVFFLKKDLKIYVRTLIGIVMFNIYYLVINHADSVAKCILFTLILLGIYTLLELLYRIIEWVEKKKVSENHRLVQSNISELHEKRLNEQLILQKIADERNAILLERENISRNIHNSVGHSITAAIMTLDAADMLYDVKPEEARKKMNDANNRIRGSLESIRRAVRVLDEDNIVLTSKDLKAELAEIARGFVMDTNIEIFQNYKQIGDDILIPNDHVVFLTGVLQESLTNGVRHGNAGEFTVVLSGDTAHIKIEITDNGKSNFKESNKNSRIEHGFGLKKILSYVDKNGGKAIFKNDDGFKTMVELPILIE